jgi:hypothetical protein
MLQNYSIFSLILISQVDLEKTKHELQKSQLSLERANSSKKVRTFKNK